MSVSTQTHASGFQIYTLTSGDDTVVVSAFGGQILSWTRGDVPIIFENRQRAVMDGKTPYRGGAPICFPYFGKGTLLPLGTTLIPQHGHARTTVWDSHVRADTAVVLATQQSTGAEYGPTEFSCELTYTLSDKLHVEAKICNVGERFAPFQFVIHSYWVTDEPSAAMIHGLGVRYLDNLREFTEYLDESSSAPHETPIDRVYPDAASQLLLTTEQYRLEILTQGCPNAVLWNPGIHHDLSDLGPPNFICLESGLITPSQSLETGEVHVVNASYRVELT